MEVVEEWPEPIVRVQSLADAEVIPERYIKPPPERPGGSSICGAAADDKTAQLLDCLPVVDLGGLTSPDAAARRATQLAVSEACKEWGFFQAVNHGVAAEAMEAVKQVWREFFDLPMEVKQGYANSPKTFEGYGSRLGVKKGALLDWGDYFFLQLFPPSVREYRMWPTLPSPLREKMEAYGEELMKVCEVVQRALSVGIGLDEEFIGRALGEAGAGMRVNYYPKCRQPDLTLGLSPHSDPGAITVLLADHHVRGLQVRKADAWITVDPLPGALIINIGDQIQVLTNEAYKSVEHRVAVNAATERLSLAFFYNPQDDVIIEPAKELLTPGRLAMYKPMTFKEYKLLMRMLGPRGKSHIGFVQSTSSHINFN